MNAGKLPVANWTPTKKGAIVLSLGILAFLLTLLFCRSFIPSQVVFSNDGPLGGLVAQQNRMPGILVGLWRDLNWIGNKEPSISPTITAMLLWVTGPVGFSKVFCPAALLILGVCAAFCLCRFGLSRVAAILGALAAALSSHFLSTAAWGVASQVICIAMNFVAVGLLYDTSGSALRRWASVALAGMAVGVGLMEGYDIGAIFSLFVAAFALYRNLIEGRPGARKWARGVACIGVVAFFAAFIAAHTLSVLISTQIKGVAGMQQIYQESKAERWDYATQWSFPPQEILRVLIPGLFGYRMDTPKDLPESLHDWYAAGVYWGRAGETPGWTENHKDPEWARTHPGAFGRFSGGGEYAGVLVVALALWALFESMRGRNSVYSPVHRKLVWFWGVAAFVSLLLEFGRYAPFYQFFYMLPYMSTIRNPAKFTHTFNWSLVILFAYGVHALSVRYLQGGALATGHGLVNHLKQWWAKAPKFDRTWTTGSLIVVALSILGWMMYATSRARLELRIQDAGLDPALATSVAGFSIREVGIYVLVLIISVAFITLILSGTFGGRRARLGAILVGLFLVVDLGRAGFPFIIYQNWQEKYATNPVIDFLHAKPFEHRVAIFPFPGPRELAVMTDVYKIEWAQHQFQFYDIQSLDVIQMPRPPADKAAFETALLFDRTTNTLYRIPRQWELTNTRYLLGPAIFFDQLNQQLDPGQHRFRMALRFDIVLRPGVSTLTQYEQLTAVAKEDGPYAIFEFAGALPRAKLYSNWQVVTNDQAALGILGSRDFAPAQTVLLAQTPPLPGPSTATNAPSGTVEFVSYAPKHIVLQAKAAAPSVLLLNDHFDPNWRVRVDGKPAELLRCNYIMRGVEVPVGEHRVQFDFAPTITPLYVSLAAIVVGLGLIGILAVPPRRPLESPATTPTATSTSTTTRR